MKKIIRPIIVLACAITSGRKLPCNDQRGGIKYIDFAPWQEYGFVVANEAIASLPVALTEVFRYEVKSTTNTLTETATTSEDNGSTEIVQALAVTLAKMDAPTQVQLKALIHGRAVAFVWDFNGNVHAVGIDSGMSNTTGTKVTGGAGADLSGYTIALQSKDSDYSPILSDAAKTALIALISDEAITP